MADMVGNFPEKNWTIMRRELNRSLLAVFALLGTLHASLGQAPAETPQPASCRTMRMQPLPDAPGVIARELRGKIRLRNSAAMAKGLVVDRRVWAIAEAIGAMSTCWCGGGVGRTYRVGHDGTKPRNPSRRYDFVRR